MGEDIVQALWRQREGLVRPIGWYSLQGWARYREAALYRIESTSSINAA